MQQALPRTLTLMAMLSFWLHACSPQNADETAADNEESNAADATRPA